MTPFVFVSHARNDGKVAQSVCAALERREIHCWIASRDVLPGQNYQAAIVEAISTAGAMVLIFSQHSNTSEEIKKELALAGQHQILVVPVRTEDVLPSGAFRYELATRQWIDLFDDWEGAIGRIASQVKSIGSPPAPAGRSDHAPALAVAPRRRARSRSRGLRLAAFATAAVAAAALVTFALFHFGVVGSRPFARFQQAGPPSEGSEIQEFTITVHLARDPPDKFRNATWSRVDANTWLEVGDDKAHSEYKVVTRIVLNLCPGTVVESVSELKYVFIPDKHCPAMDFQISYDGAHFGVAAEMKHVI